MAEGCQLTTQPLGTATPWTAYWTALPHIDDCTRAPLQQVVSLVAARPLTSGWASCAGALRMGVVDGMRMVRGAHHPRLAWLVMRSMPPFMVRQRVVLRLKALNCVRGVSFSVVV